MAAITTITCLLFMILSYIITKNIINPIFLFNCWWGVTIYISSIGLFDTFVPQDSTYFVFLIAALSFNFSLIFMIKGTKNKKIKTSTVPIGYSNIKHINYIILFFQFIALTVLILRSKKTLDLISSGVDYSLVRYHYYNLETIMAGYDHLINNLFILPLLTFSTIYLSLQFFEKKYSRVLIFTTFLSIGLHVFSSGGRSIILSSGIIFLSSYFITNHLNIRIKFSKKVNLYFFLTLIVCLLVFISLKRIDSEGGLTAVLSTVIRYFSSSYYYFEQLLPLAKEDGINLYGGAFFGGILDILILIFRALGFEFTLMSSYISTYNQMYIAVSTDGTIYNAFPTMLYTFFYDYSYLGIIIGSLIFGVISVIFYRKMLIKNTYCYKGIYVVVILAIFESPMRWEGTFIPTWVTIFLFLLMDIYLKKVNKIASNTNRGRQYLIHRENK